VDISVALEGVVGLANTSSTSSALAEIGLRSSAGDANAWVVRPGSAAEVTEVVRLANGQRIAVIPVGGGARGPDEKLRARPRFYLDCRRMNHVLHLDETSLVVHVQAGLTALGLEKILAPRGLSLGDYPPAALGSTVGGLLSVRTPGKSSRRHGFIEDAVLGLSAVLPDGRSIHTRVAPRRATGPDLTRALCGSEGTLGVITSAVLRIHRRPESRFFSAHALPSVEAALRAVRNILREEVQPAAMRLYDAAEAYAHFRSDVCDEGEALLLVAAAGPTDLAACDRDLATSAVDAEGGRKIAMAIVEQWWRWRTGHDPDTAPSPPDLQVGATPGKQLAVYEAVLVAVQAEGATARAHISRFDLDGAVLFFSFGRRGEAVSAALLATAERAVVASGGHLLEGSKSEFAVYYRELKRELDPYAIMNPGVELS
jgi:alkyldihydroxyacetonephosphate synthase